MNNYDNVARLKMESGLYDVSLPYKAPQLKTFFGSAFVVEITKSTIILMTNAHVVANALNIEAFFPFTGKHAIPCVLRSFCYFMDLALVEVKISDIPSKSVHQQIKPLKFADSLQVKKSEELTIIGYPLGDKNIQISKGNVSGFTNLKTDDINFGPTSYIQVTSPLNGGNSGGPGLNNKGDVVGIATATPSIITNNIGFILFVNFFY